MSTGDTEEVPTAERQLVVYQEIPQEPVLETCLAQRYWRLGDTRPIKYSLDSGFEDLRCFYQDWNFFQYSAERDIYPGPEQAEDEYKELDNILHIRGTLFFNFPKEQGWDFLYQRVLAFVHGEQILAEEFLSAPLSPIDQGTAKRLNFWYTRNFRHTYIPNLEFTATFDQQRREIAQTSLTTHQARDPYYIGPDPWRVNRRVRQRTNSWDQWARSGHWTDSAPFSILD